MIHAVKVTQRDINNGIQKDGNMCPIALAFRQKYNYRDKDFLSVWLKEGLLYMKGLGYYLLNAKAVQFEKDFDEGLSVQPFTIYFLVDQSNTGKD